MKRKLYVLGAIGVLSLAILFGCENDKETGCEDAKREMEKNIDDICSEGLYASKSLFCRICVAADAYSVSIDSDKCVCRPLTFDQDFCSFEKGDNAKAKIRGAIDYMDSVCTNKTVDASSAQEEAGSVDPDLEAGVDGGFDASDSDAD